MTATTGRARLRWFRYIALAVLATGGVLLARDHTQSTHSAMDPASRLRVVVEPVHNRSEPSQDLATVARARIEFCDLEVSSAIQGRPTVASEDPVTVTLIFSPALDQTDRKQFRGCVEDWQVDNHLLRVRSMQEYRVR